MNGKPVAPTMALPSPSEIVKLESFRCPLGICFNLDQNIHFLDGMLPGLCS